MNMIVKLLQNIPLFSGMTTEELQEIAPLFQERTYRKGVIIFFEGETGEELFVIKSGFVRVMRIDNSKEITLALFQDGEFFGEMALIQRGLARSATVETLESTIVYALGKSEFMQFMEKHPEFSYRLLEVTMQRLRDANEQIHDLTFLDVRSRIVKALVKLTDEYGVASGTDIELRLKLTHQQLANLVGTSRETATKILQELQDEGIIEIVKKVIVIKKFSNLKHKMGKSSS